MDGTDFGTLQQAEPVNMISENCCHSGAGQVIIHQGNDNTGCVSSRHDENVEGVRRLVTSIDSLHKELRNIQSINLHVRATVTSVIMPTNSTKFQDNYGVWVEGDQETVPEISLSIVVC